MAWDFCSPHLRPRIYCDKVSVDDHEITNLISEDYFVKSKGFLAERFIKPPVQITVALPCNINIHKIVIDPIVSSQKSCGFEIMTRSDPLKDSWIVNDEIPMEKSPHTEGMFVSVGRCTRDYSGRAVFIFTNQSYRSKSSLSQNTSQDIDFSGLNVVRSEIRHFRNISLGCVSHVMIRVTRTQGGCIPCVKSIAVFGQPSHTVPKVILDRIWYLHSQFCKGPKTKIDVTPKTLPLVSHVSEEDIKISSAAEHEDEIPNEFIDPITCDIMTIPLLLPSGHSIDKYTLERHISEESKWGRTPNDPFTGVAFHGMSKPIPNSSLKVRIDQFLVKSGMKFKNVARTVGQSGDLLNRGVSFSSVYNTSPRFEQSSDSDCEIIEMPTKVDSAGVDCKPISQEQSKTHSLENAIRKRKASDCSMPGDKKRRINAPAAKSVSLGGPDPVVGACHKLPFAIANRTKDFTHTTHEKNLSHSLDSAVSLTLGNLPSFRKSAALSKTSNATQSSTMCVMCNLDLKSSKMAAYLLPCSHKLCRDCLLSETKLSNEVICNCCLSTWSSKDIRKTYVS
jgi:U-box domain-containing protein 5